jgi:hypothetical protein
MKLNESLFEEATDGTLPAATGGAGEATPVGANTPIPDAESMSELNLDDILSEDVDGEEDVSVAKPDPKPAAAPVVPPVASAPQPAPVTPTPSPTAAPTAPVTPPPVETTVTQTPKPDFQQLRANEMTRLATAYALSEDDARSMAIEPEKVLPMMAAKVHLDVFEAVMHGITSLLPQFLEAQTQQRTASESAKTEFFSEFPGLKDDKFQQEIKAALLTYRQFNPSATRAQAIAAAGVQVSLMHGVVLPEKYFKGLAGTTAPAPVETPRANFTPASPGGSTTPASPDPANYYTRIAQEEIFD